MDNITRKEFYLSKSKCESLSCILLFATHGLQLARLLCPWNSPGKNTGVGCHALLQGIFLTQGSNPDLLHRRQKEWILGEPAVSAIASLIIMKQEVFLPKKKKCIVYSAHFPVSVRNARKSSSVTSRPPVWCQLPGHTVSGVQQSELLSPVLVTWQSSCLLLSSLAQRHFCWCQQCVVPCLTQTQDAPDLQLRSEQLVRCLFSSPVLYVQESIKQEEAGLFQTNRSLSQCPLKFKITTPWVVQAFDCSESY